MKRLRLSTDTVSSRPRVPELVSTTQPGRTGIQDVSAHLRTEKGEGEKEEVQVSGETNGESETIVTPGPPKKEGLTVGERSES